MPINADLATKVWYRYQYARDTGHTAYVKKADVCDRFFQGDQWSPEDLAKLRMARRPALTINKIISTISNVMGEQIFNRSEISYRPRSGAPESNAEILNKVYSQISDVSQLNWKRSDMFADGIITSRGFLDVRMDFSESLTGKVCIDNMNPKNVLIDPDAEDYDPDTWNEVMTTKWVTIDDIEMLYGKDEADWLRNKSESYFPFGYDSIEVTRDMFGDRMSVNYTGGVGDYLNAVMRKHRLIERQHKVLDRQQHFVDPRSGLMRPVPTEWDRNRIAMVKQQFGFEVIPKLVKRIRWTVISDNVVLHDNWSPYKHFTIVPYFPYFRRGRTVGLVENLLGSQELLNKASSQELHVINTTANSGWKVKTGTLTNMSVEELEARGAETGLVIETNGDPDKDIVKITPNQVPTGLDRITYKAEEHIKTISNVPDSVMGQDRADVAAKAIQQKRQAASTNQAKPLDSLVRTDFILARNIVDLIQTFWTEEQVLTVTNDRATGATEQLTINQITPEGQVLNDVTLGEYDVVVTSVPVRETLEDSQFDQAVAMRELSIGIPDEVLIMSSRLQNKKEILAKMAAAGQSPQAQEQARLALEAQQAEVDKTKAETTAKQADTSLKTAKAQKEGVLAGKEAATPPESNAGDAEAAYLKTQQEMQHAQEKHEQEMQMMREKMQLAREEADNKRRLEAQAAAQKAVEDRVARMTSSTKTPGEKRA